MPQFAFPESFALLGIFGLDGVSVVAILLKYIIPFFNMGSIFTFIYKEISIMRLKKKSRLFLF